MLASVLIAALLTAAGPPPPACDDTCRIGAARAYLDALVSHDPSAVPLHPAATRTEAGLPTGFSGAQIRADLRYGPQYRVITGVRDARFTAHGDQVIAEFTLELFPPVIGARVHEVFTLDDGLITTIVADIAVVAR